MNTVIDTLRYSEKLQVAGFATEQANALAWALNDEIGQQFATRIDVREIVKEISGSIEMANKSMELKFEVINVKIGSLETRINFTFALIALLVMLELVPVVKPLLG